MFVLGLILILLSAGALVAVLASGTDDQAVLYGGAVHLPTLVIFLAGAAAPKRIMLRAGLILVVTWVARWFGVLFLLHAVGVHAGVGAALLYMVVTGLANTMPFLPGNIGLYQGAAIGALALSGHQGTKVVAASLLTPAAVSLATAAAATVGLALYARNIGQLGRAAIRA